MNVPERKTKLKQIQKRLDDELPIWAQGYASLASNGEFDIKMRRRIASHTEMSPIIRIVDGIMEEEGFVESK